MDIAITAVRIPIALFVSLLLLVMGWSAEILLGLVFFPFHAVFQSRMGLKITYGAWPLNTFHTISNVWQWVFRGDEHKDMKPGLGDFIGNLIGLPR